MILFQSTFLPISGMKIKSTRQNYKTAPIMGRFFALIDIFEGILKHMFYMGSNKMGKVEEINI
ncbi:MAG: hypothetical protein J1E98_00050 [Lachnospiraceae bacterium]|nr:hypothetical protein [Lachnospiraceae bacterium]